MRLINSVNIMGLLAPHVTIDTVRQLKVYNDKLVPTRRAWGALAITSDGLIMLVRMLIQLHRDAGRQLISSHVLPYQRKRQCLSQGKESLPQARHAHP